MWEAISKLIGANSTAVLVITIFGTFSVWLYKEFRTMNKENFKNKLATVNKKIEMYSKLEAAIAGVLHHKNTDQAKATLYDKFGEFSPYFSDNVRKIMRDYYRRDDTGLLNTLLAFTEVEVKLLEKEKSLLYTNESSTDMVDSIQRLVRPLGQLMIVWVTILFMLTFIINFTNMHSVLSKFNWVLVSLSCFVSLILIYAIVSLLVDQKLGKLGWRRWLQVIGMSVPPWLSVIYVDYIVLPIAIQVLSLVLFARAKKKPMKKIILLD